MELTQHPLTPHLYYAIDNGSYTSVKATSIGTCDLVQQIVTSKHKPLTSLAGEYVTYFWAYQDGASTPNMLQVHPVEAAAVQALQHLHLTHTGSSSMTQRTLVTTRS